MANPLRRHTSVKWDLVEIYDYIADDSISAADRVLDAIEETFNVLARVPLAGVRYRSGIPDLSEVRMLPVKNFETYLIFYLPGDPETRILYVFHGAREIREHMRDDLRR